MQTDIDVPAALPADPAAVLALLVLSRQQIADHANWTVGHHARDATGNPVNPKHASACQHCARGAVIKHDPGATFVLGTLGMAAMERLNTVAIARGYRQDEQDDAAARLNDDSRHRDVLAMFDEAIVALASQVMQLAAAVGTSPSASSALQEGIAALRLARAHGGESERAQYGHACQKVEQLAHTLDQHHRELLSQQRYPTGNDYHQVIYLLGLDGATAGTILPSQLVDNDR